MMTFEEVKRLAESGDYGYIPLSDEIFSDMKTPVEVLRILLGVSRHCYMLESAEEHRQWGRYTFLGYDPKSEITCADGAVKITENGESRKFDCANPDEIIKKIISDHKSPVIPELPTFTGGLVGYFSYDYIKYSEPTLKLDPKDEERFNDVDLMLFDKVIAFDNFRQKIILICNIETKDLESSYEKGKEILKSKYDVEI